MNTAIISCERENPVWMDLWDYIQSADRDDVGRHDLGSSTYGMHIYNGRRQVNITDSNGLSIVDFVFEDEDQDGKPTQVWIVPVNTKGIADYDGGRRIPTAAFISGTEAEPWISGIRFGGAVREIFRDLLIPRLPINSHKA